MFSATHAFFVTFTLLSVFGSHSQMAPAAGNARLLELGTSQGYSYTTSVLLNDGTQDANAVGYRINADVGVAVVWQQGPVKLLQFELSSPRLIVKSAKEKKGEAKHKSLLEKMSNSPFLVEWNHEKIKKVYINEEENTSLKNLKKGIASVFQFQTLDGSVVETDISGICSVSYHSIDPFTILKRKDDCRGGPGVPYVNQSEPILSTQVNSSRSAVYTLSRDFSLVESVKGSETHSMGVLVKDDAYSLVSTSFELNAGAFKVKAKQLKASDINSAVKEFQKNMKISAKGESLEAVVSPQTCSKDECPSLPNLVKEHREGMRDELVGTIRSANAFTKLLAAGRTATKEDLTKAFKGTKNKEIMLQLSDLAGAINTIESHEVIKKLVNFESEEDLDVAERYLWALSRAFHPNIDIIKDVYKMSQRPNNVPKIAETLQLTIASLARQFGSLPGQKNHIVVQDVTNAITTALEECKDEECKHKNLRALRNLLCPSTIPELLKHALKGKPKTSVEAMKTLRSFPRNVWDESVIDVAQRIYFQAGRRYDSSARTLALDILLEANPSRNILKELIESLLEYDPMFEVKQYLNQRLQQISSENDSFAKTVGSIRDELRSSFNNYNVLAQRGLTTAFTRSFASSSAWSGSLVNIQEVSGGLLKRGIVDVVLSTPESSSSVFTLGLFAGGLSSFVTSNEATRPPDSNEVEDVEEEAATAGMELSVMGTRIRPFVFFSGQGELMGHVWSGTASEKTPAYQSIIVSHDHLEHIVLQNGIVAQLQVLGATSFDLSGQITMSLWNRNAHSLVEQNAGVSLLGRIQADTSFVKSQVEFNVATEVHLNLISDLNFYSGISLCMQLVQPDAVLRHNVHKVERIIGSKHRLRKSKYQKVNLPGRTYVLNQKNNEMCSVIFKDK